MPRQGVPTILKAEIEKHYIIKSVSKIKNSIWKNVVKSKLDLQWWNAWWNSLNWKYFKFDCDSWHGQILAIYLSLSSFKKNVINKFNAMSTVIVNYYIILLIIICSCFYPNVLHILQHRITYLLCSPFNMQHCMYSFDCSVIFIFPLFYIF